MQIIKPQVSQTTLHLTNCGITNSDPISIREFVWNSDLALDEYWDIL